MLVNNLIARCKKAKMKSKKIFHNAFFRVIIMLIFLPLCFANCKNHNSVNDINNDVLDSIKLEKDIDQLNKRYIDLKSNLDSLNYKDKIKRKKI
ncbi:hypothetical protein CEQ90_20535, partial [Lewinellaceae bacterium SD302]